MPQNYGELLHLQERPQDFLCPDGDKEAVTRARTYLGSMKYTTEDGAPGKPAFRRSESQAPSVKNDIGKGQHVGIG